jgi:tRNA:m4X modification enzyme
MQMDQGGGLIKGRKRIPCPIDPSHYIFEDMVEKHLPICPKAKKQRQQEEQEYYKTNINCGGYGDLCTPRTEDPSIEWAEKIALRVLQVHQRIFAKNKLEQKEQLAALSFEELHNALPLNDLSKPELEAGMMEGFNAYKIKTGGSRHIPQLASLVGHLRAADALPKIDDNSSAQVTTPTNDDKPLVLLEMGAGRGVFGLSAVGVANARNMNAHLVMVERAGTRSKADKIFRTAGEVKTAHPYLKLDNIQFSRLVCDLAHINLPVVVEQEKFREGKVVVIAKHLCGAGTDIALKSLEPIKAKVKACVFATCCHGICDWKEYVGRDYLRREMEGGEECLNFGPSEFDLLRRWCAGSVANRSAGKAAESSTMNDKPDEGPAEHSEHIDVVDGTREDQMGGSETIPISVVAKSLNLACGVPGLGRACQRLIDYGRSEFMRKRLFADHASPRIKLHHYVECDVTPQNAVLIAETSELSE